MKKIFILTLLIATVILACSRKTVATKEEPVIPQREASITPIKPNDATTSSTPAPVATDAATIAFGKTIYETKCGRCHGLKDVTAYSEQRWEGILRSMAPKAKLTETETQQVASYVKANAKK